MRSLIRFLPLFALLVITLTALAQSEPKDSAEGTGSISGRVQIDAKAAAGCKVVVFKSEDHGEEKFITRVKTDADGQYRVTKLPPGYYKITLIAPAYVEADAAVNRLSGKSVAVKEGESVEGIDFSLIRGGVITGRVTTAERQPVTGERVRLERLGPGGEKEFLYEYPQPDYGTDDRGIYRIYGLPPGRYLVSAGKDPEQSSSRIGAVSYFPRTFYPGVSDESKAAIVEVKAGAEVTGIDIAFGQSHKTYSASGRVVDARTGKPLPNVQIAYGRVYETEAGHSSSSHGGYSADSRGGFRFDGLMPGTYYVQSVSGPESDLYSNFVSFQIQDQDISGLEVKVRPGSTISGVLAVEGSGGPEVMAKLSRLNLWASTSSPDIIRGAHNTSRKATINPDGTFQVKGLHPGKIFLHLATGPDTKSYFVSGVERGGVEQAQGIEVAPGGQVNDVRVILGQATGRIRGRVKVEGGKLPVDAQINVSVWRSDGSPMKLSPVESVEPDGQFLIQYLTTGEYRVDVHIFTRDGIRTVSLADTESKEVSVTNGAETEVTITVELPEKDKDQN